MNERSQRDLRAAPRAGERIAIPAATTDGVETSDSFFMRDEVVAEYASFGFLLEPERVILDDLGDLSQARVLDIGVGGGRTTAHLAGRTRAYVGVDLSPKMVQACRARFADRLGPELQFAVGSATDLGAFADASFDLVLFAFNGIDSIVRHDDRLCALREVRRVCAPGATFAFSSDNLLFARRQMHYANAIWDTLRRGGQATRPTHLRHAAIATRRRRQVNRPLRGLREPHARYIIERPVFELSAAHVEEPGRRILIDGYCIEPDEQLRQLQAQGFEQIEVLGMDGSCLTHASRRQLGSFSWLYYVARTGL